MIGEMLRAKVRRARESNSPLVRSLDALRRFAQAEHRAALWTRITHGDALHQTSGTSWPERYPELFDLAASLAPDARRVLSFGCSSGEELEALRRRFPSAEIVGAEINPALRKRAKVRMAADARTCVVAPDGLEGQFDAVFALAVLQRLPEQVAAREVMDLSQSYPFERFDAELARLAARLRAGGLLCVINAHYRVEDSSTAAMLEAIADSPAMTPPLFGRDSQRLQADAIARSIFRKIA